MTNTISDYHFEKYTDQFESVTRQIKEIATPERKPVDIRTMFTSFKNQGDDSIQRDTDEL